MLSTLGLSYGHNNGIFKKATAGIRQVDHVDKIYSSSSPIPIFFRKPPSFSAALGLERVRLQFQLDQG